MAGHFVLGSSHFHLGQFEQSRTDMEEALRILPRCADADLKSFAVVDVGMFHAAYLPHALWHLGYPDLASRRSEEAVGEARKSHPFSLAIALNYAAMLNLFARESRKALSLAEEATAVCRRYDFAYYGSMAEIVAGWAEAMEGSAEGGLARLRGGFDGLKATAAELRVPFYHALLAEASARAGKSAEALANVSSGLAFQSKNQEIWSASYLHRVEGDLLIEAGRREEARASYERAVTAANRVGARMMQIRALTQLCRLGHPREALKGLYLQFTEGFETEDLREARSLLAS